MNTNVKLIEVGPRDGLQIVKEYVPLETKIKLIDKLIEAGYKSMEITSFVSPKAIPQMKDAKEVAKYALEKYPNLDLYALIPNMYGANTANELGMKKVSIVVSVSESHNKANINRTVDESINDIKEIMEKYPNLEINISVATAFGCPFEGEIKTEQVLDLVSKLSDIGIRQFTICDTIGIAIPSQVREVFTELRKLYPDYTFGAHIHDTRNMGILNTYIAIESGANEVQTSIGGLGGCPFAPGASGNTSSEDLVYMLNREGYNTGIDFKSLLDVARYAKDNIDGNFSGHQINIENNN